MMKVMIYPFRCSKITRQPTVQFLAPFVSTLTFSEPKNVQFK